MSLEEKEDEGPRVLIRLERNVTRHTAETVIA